MNTVVSQLVTVFNISEFSDGGYDYDDSNETVSFKCNQCSSYVDGFIRHGIYLEAICQNCGNKV